MQEAHRRRDDELSRRLEAADAGSVVASRADVVPPIPGAEHVVAAEIPVLPAPAPAEPPGDQDDAGEAEQMHVEPDGDAELLESLTRGGVPGIRSVRVAREATQLFEMLLVWGVSRGDAEAKVVELFSPPRVTAALGTLPCMTLVGGPTFDLRCDANGVAWDFRRKADRQRAREQIRRERPFLLIGSPPCTAFSAVQALNRERLGPEELRRRRAEAMVLLGFSVELYWDQLRNGRHFLHEHPATASSWKEGMVARLRRDPRVGEVVGDQCRYGLRTRGPGGALLPARKPTRFLSSAPAILDELSLRCRGVHLHQPLLGGGRTSAAAVYPPGLCRAILRGAELQLQHDRGAIPACVQKAVDEGVGLYDLHPESAAQLSQSDLLGSVVDEGCMTPEVAQTELQDEDVALREHGCTGWAPGGEAGSEGFWDEVSGEPLPTAQVQAARREEVAFMEEWKCWTRVTWEEAVRCGGRKPIQTRWVDVNKGDF